MNGIIEEIKQRKGLIVMRILIAAFLCVFALAPHMAVANDNTENNVEIPMLKERVLGDPNAPVTIIEHSSFTCPHCRSFHVDTLPMIKERLIETGQVKLKFDDFPLNANAVQAGMIARCFEDNDLYFDYVDFLFQTQEDWAFLQDPRPYLAQNARLLGLSSDQLNACMTTEGYENAYIRKVQMIAEMKQIQSTPTFIIAETGQRIAGNKPFLHFEAAVENALAAQEQEKDSESENAE